MRLTHSFQLRNHVQRAERNLRRLALLTRCPTCRRDDDADQRQGQLLESAMAVSFSVQS